MAKNYEEGSVLDFAMKGLANIQSLSKSSLISEKLIGLNTLVFVIVMTLNISAWIFGINQGLSLAFLFGLGISAIFALFASLFYIELVSLIMNFSENKIEPLRIGLMLIFISLPIATAGLMFNLKLLTDISLGIIALQIFVILFGQFIKFSKTPVQDETVSPVDLWKVVNNVSAVCGIISFALTIAIIIIKGI